jgi:hypothetical protein
MVLICNEIRPFGTAKQTRNSTLPTHDQRNTNAGKRILILKRPSYRHLVAIWRREGNNIAGNYGGFMIYRNPPPTNMSSSAEPITRSPPQLAILSADM